MQALDITFSVNTYPATPASPADLLHPSFVAEWNGNRAAGVCKLPYRRDEVPHLQFLLSVCQREDDYQAPSHYDDFEWGTLERHGLVESQPGPLLTHPILKIGRSLYSALFGANERLSALFQAFLSHAPSDQHRLLALHFVQSADERDITRELLALPWEALWNPENPNYPVSIWKPYEQKQGGLVIVRTYQSNVFATREQAPIKPPELPTLLTLLPKTNMDAARYRDNERQARPPIYARVDPAASGPPIVWCNMPEPAPGLTAPEINALVEQRRPQILHYFGHGEFEHELFAFAVDQPENAGAQTYAPRAALINWRGRGVRLLAAFACHSGSVGAVRGLLGVDAPNASLVTTMAEELPAMLLMQTPIAVDVAAVASQVFYGALAAGRSVVSAVYALREALFDPSRSPRPEHAWWVPVLYLRDVCDELVFVKPERRTHLRLGKAEGWIAFERHEQRRRQIMAAIGTPGVIQVQGDANSGKTALLQRIVRDLEESKQPYIALRVCTDPSCPVCKDFDSRARLEALQREVACFVDSLQHTHIEWDHAHDQYRACITGYAGARPLAIIVDDIDHGLRDGDLDQLLLPQETIAATYIVATGLNYTLPQAQVQIELPHYKAEEWQTIKHIAYEDYESNNEFMERRKTDEWFRFFCRIVFGIRIPLFTDEIVEIARSSNIQLTTDAISEPARILADYVRADYVRADDNRRYELYDHEMHQKWMADHKTYDYHDVIRAVELWRNSRANTAHKATSQNLGVRHYPASLLQIIADEQHRLDIDPFEEEPQYKLTAPWLHGWPYGAWQELAWRYQDERQTELFEDLVEHRCTSKRYYYTRLDRALLQLFSLRARQEEQQYVANAAYLWAAYLPEKHYRTRAWLAQYREIKPPSMRLLESALKVADDAGQIGQLIALLKAPDLASERAFALRFVVVPALGPTRGDQILALVEALQDDLGPAEQAALGRAIAVAFRDQSDHTAMAWARQWCEQLCAGHPRLAVPLVFALAPALTHDQQKHYVDLILACEPGVLEIDRDDHTLSEIDQVAHASFLYYHASYDVVHSFSAGLEPDGSNRTVDSVHKARLDFVRNSLRCKNAAQLKSTWERLKSEVSSFGEALDAFAAFIRCSLMLKLSLDPANEIMAELDDQRTAFEKLSDPTAIATLMALPAVTFRPERSTYNGVRRRLDLSRGMLLATVAEQDAETRLQWHAAYLQEFHSAPMAASLANQIAPGADERAASARNMKYIGTLIDRSQVLLDEHIIALKDRYTVDDLDDQQIEQKCQIWREKVEPKIKQLLDLYDGVGTV